MEAEWSWRKKTYRKTDARLMPLQFYYLLSEELNDVTLAWECVPSIINGERFFPANSYPCVDWEIKKLEQMRRRRLGIKPKTANEAELKKSLHEAKQKLPF